MKKKTTPTTVKEVKESQQDFLNQNPQQVLTQKQITDKLLGTELSIKDNLLLTNIGELPFTKWFKIPGVEGLFIKCKNPVSYGNAGVNIMNGEINYFEEDTQVLGVKKVNMYLN